MNGLLNWGAVYLTVYDLTTNHLCIRLNAYAHFWGRCSDVHLGMQGDLEIYFKLIMVTSESPKKYQKWLIPHGCLCHIQCGLVSLPVAGPLMPKVKLRLLSQCLLLIHSV